MTAGGERPMGPAEAGRALAHIELLRHVSSDELAELADVVEWRRVQAGEEVFAQGDLADGLYLVVRGRLESVADGRLLGEVGRGELVGELALLLDHRRTATVRAVRDSLLVRLPAELAPDLFAASPTLAVELARLVARRAGAGGTRTGTGPRSVAVVSLDPEVDANRLADALAERVGRAGGSWRIDAQGLQRWYERGGSDEVAQRLAEHEDRHEALVVTVPHDPTDPATAPLVAVTLRQMDLVVLVTRPTSSPAGPLLDLVAAAHRPATLVVIHPDRSSPTGTGRLLAGLETKVVVRDHVHVRQDDAADLDRLARVVGGRSVGLVLGGGGSRGFAHLGVVRALREAGIPIDRVGGSSMGAIIAGQVAQGTPVDELIETNARTWSRRRLVEPGLPTLSLLRGREAVRVLGVLLGERHLEDLWLDCFCTTVDLSSFRLHVARRGPVAHWARASATVPGLWPPHVDDDGHLHVDGGLLDNVPTDIMRAGNVGTVIGVDVCKRQAPMTLAGPRALPAGLSLLRERRRQWFPTIVDVLNRSSLLASLQTHEAADRHADLVLAPPVEDEGFAAFDRIRALAEVGYRYATAELERHDLGPFA